VHYSLFFHSLYSAENIAVATKDSMNFRALESLKTSRSACTLKYKVHVICWDGREYDREATKDEIEDYLSIGIAYRMNDSTMCFNFKDLPKKGKK
jgi:hypothetical protein